MSSRTNETEEQVYQHDFFHTTSVTDFRVIQKGNPPPGYPAEPCPDEYTVFPFEEEYEKRKEAFLEHCLRNPAAPTIKGYYYELARLYENAGPVYEGAIEGALEYIDKRFDCSDFVLLGIIRLLYQFPDSKLISEELLAGAKKTVLGFKYWPGEPGIDSMCYWTENHQIMFLSSEYLAGQLYPAEVFSNSKMTGREKMDHARPRILQWLSLRYKTGFSEWLSHIYYDEDITALVNLVDFCRDEEIAAKAKTVLNLLLYDLALNNFYGTFSSTHGRSYGKEKKNALVESTIDTAKLLFGMGIFSGSDNMSAVTLALSPEYTLPPVIYEVAKDQKRPEMINRQRMGLKIDEAEKWGLNFKDLDSGMVFLSMEAYTHPKTIALTMKMFDAFRWWENQFFDMFKAKKKLIDFLRTFNLLGLFARLFEKDITRNAREEVNLYTYRTPDYMLSAAQDYRAGYGGDQQHIWQATLSPSAVCFTTHPGSKEDSSAGYWVGSGTLPRVAQVKNVLIAVYKISRMPGIYMTNKLFFTHAWLPRDCFDEVVEEKDWVFGRKGDGYIALRSQNSYYWQTEGDDAGCEIIASGLKNIWICEMGRSEVDGEFEAFIDKIASASIVFNGLNVAYNSPSQGLLEFGWQGSLRQEGKVVELGGYPRYDNPYSKADFPLSTLTIENAGKDATWRLFPK